MKLFLFVITIITFGAFAPAGQAQSIEARTVIALYDSQQTPQPHTSLAHVLAEMPLNHLGLVLHYHDINQPPLELENKAEEVRGVLSWFTAAPQNKQHQQAYHEWAIALIKANKKFVLMGESSFWQQEGNAILLEMIGIVPTGQWFSRVDAATMQSVEKNEDILDFERPVLGDALFSFPQMHLTNGAVSHLKVARGRDDSFTSNLVVTSPQGGYVASGFAIYVNDAYKTETRQWYINPFAFFAEAFATQNLPKPDVTTMAGRRLYFSHVDGDGWRNLTHLEQYRDVATLCASVWHREIARVYPDLPVTLGVIAGDINKEWLGDETSRSLAENILQEPHIEAASHTLSHPFNWQFFAEYTPEKEKPYLENYMGPIWTEKAGSRAQRQRLRQQAYVGMYESSGGGEDSYATPRAYAAQPFSLMQEIVGAAKEIEALAPVGKTVELVQWSGDTSPFEGALRLARQHNIANINGGDTRFDSEFNSVAWVSAIGRSVGAEQQIYAAATNENNYTKSWTENFGAFHFVQETFKNTEYPRRLKPINLYYHLYSAEFEASLQALHRNLEFIRKQEITPITTTQYARVAEGFYTTELQLLADKKWRVQNRGALQTIRFDDQETGVDWQNSEGVVGYRFHQGALYVYLDKAVEAPIIVLGESVAPQPWLQDSRWQVWELKQEDNKAFSFTAQGFGAGEMRWQMPEKGQYTIELSEGESQTITTNAQGILAVTLEHSAITPVRVTFAKTRPAEEN